MRETLNEAFERAEGLPVAGRGWHTMEEASRELRQAHARRDGAPPQG